MQKEDSKNQLIHREKKERERRDDVRMQKEYGRMQDRQEQDRHNEVIARENRAQEFMNRMADGVLAEMEELQKKEDQMVAKYQRQKELKLRKEEERKERMAKRAKETMK